jgi:hypothetical protein
MPPPSEVKAMLRRKRKAAASPAVTRRRTRNPEVKPKSEYHTLQRNWRNAPMMAKMFYTLDEAKAALGKNEEEIKQYAREGRLARVSRRPALMFKADQVEQLKSELGGGGGGRDPRRPRPVRQRRADRPRRQQGRHGSGISLVDSDWCSRRRRGMAAEGRHGPGADLGSPARRRDAFAPAGRVARASR